MGKERIVTVPNPDKEGHHQDARRPGLYPSHPARIIFSGRSGCGKGVAAKNLLARASPPFERIVIWHYDTETLEYEDCEPSGVIAELPDDPSQFWDRPPPATPPRTGCGVVGFSGCDLAGFARRAQRPPVRWCRVARGRVREVNRRGEAPKCELRPEVQHQEGRKGAVFFFKCI